MPDDSFNTSLGQLTDSLSRLSEQSSSTQTALREVTEALNRPKSGSFVSTRGSEWEYFNTGMRKSSEVWQPPTKVAASPPGATMPQAVIPASPPAAASPAASHPQSSQRYPPSWNDIQSSIQAALAAGSDPVSAAITPHINRGAIVSAMGSISQSPISRASGGYQPPPITPATSGMNPPEEQPEFGPLGMAAMALGSKAIGIFGGLEGINIINNMSVPGQAGASNNVQSQISAMVQGEAYRSQILNRFGIGDVAQNFADDLDDELHNSVIIGSTFDLIFGGPGGHNPFAAGNALNGGHTEWLRRQGSSLSDQPSKEHGT
jgi:hypothetical protein